ncbi:MAG: aminotransferase class III-fold pyridoxal phosphate-dependent enzyme, partial [Pseudomonadota bacterium]
EALMSLAPKHLVNFPQPLPDTAGLTESVSAEVLVAPFNDLAFAQSLIAEHGHEIAGVIVEPLQRLIPPAPGFLEGLRSACTEAGILLIFDEVVTGFRLAYGGAQEIYGVKPDLCTLGKIIGGGMPLAAIAGRADIMELFDKAAGERFLYQVGTLSGNPVAAAAGLKTLEILRRPGAYETIRGHGERLMASAKGALDRAGIAHDIVGDPVLFDVVFNPLKVRDYRGVFAADRRKSETWNRTLRASGIFKSEGKIYPHLALTEADLTQTEAAFERAAQAVAGLPETG